MHGKTVKNIQFNLM